MDTSLQLHRYRQDRRKLLEFLLSEGLVREIRTSSGPATSFSDLNLDFLSTDYVLQCIQSGGVLDVVQGTKRFNDESKWPVVMNSHTRDFYYLNSDTNSAGPPPLRAPPPIPVGPPEQDKPRNHTRVPQSDVTAPRSTSSDSLDNVISLALGLPSLRTGLSDDDLQESGYELFLVCMMLSGVDIQTIEAKKKEKTTKILSALKSNNNKDKRPFRPQSNGRHLEIIDKIRVQMQISETKDAVLRRQVARLASGQTLGHVDLCQISLGFLHGGFRSDFVTDKSYSQWKDRHVNILEELLYSANNTVTEKNTTGNLLTKIRKSEEGKVKMSYSDRNEVLFALKQVASRYSSMPTRRFGIQGETYFWVSGYHLNLRLYEKLLFGVFDTLDDDQLIEEADEYFNNIKLTRSILGITPKIHSALYVWVLFHQFVATDAPLLLDHTITEVQNVLRTEESDKQEMDYINNLICHIIIEDSEIKLNLIQSILLSISSWCDKKLQDYHLHFSQKASMFKKVVTLALTAGTYNFNESSHIKSKASNASGEVLTEKVKIYIEKSMEAFLKRVKERVFSEYETENSHPLALLASELKLIIDRELSLYLPVFRRFYPEAGISTAKIFHHFYGERLKPFLDDVTSLSKEVRAILPKAVILERSLIELYLSAFQEIPDNLVLSEEFNFYKIGEISQPIILDWLMAQQERVLEWTGRAFDIEEWDPLSSQQKHAQSAVEVFRIIEEIVDQLFELGLPIDITHLRALLSLIFLTLDTYLSKMISQLVDKNKLYPSPPPLTRFGETTFPIIKKKIIDTVIMENEINDKISKLTVSKLCIRLNTLQYIQKHISVLEDTIRKSWASSRNYENYTWSNGNSPIKEETIDELFVATFDWTRDTASNATKTICNLIGTRVVFWDLREQFLNLLYHGGVENSRFENILPHFDNILNDVCDLIDHTMKDRVVTSVCKASLEGFVWVLLDGGPARSFLESDKIMMEEDLHVLKDLFVAEGEGLPRSLVEEDSKFAQQVLDLFSLETSLLIQKLKASSEKITIKPDVQTDKKRSIDDAHTLLRVLCHKKDKEASNFLKQQYQLPASSEYIDSVSEDSPKSPGWFNWSGSGKGSSSFRSSSKKRFEESTW